MPACIIGRIFSMANAKEFSPQVKEKFISKHSNRTITLENISIEIKLTEPECTPIKQSIHLKAIKFVGIHKTKRT